MKEKRGLCAWMYVCMYTPFPPTLSRTRCGEHSSMQTAHTHTRSPPDVIVFVISGDRSSFLLYHARGLKLRLITLRQ